NPLTLILKDFTIEYYKQVLIYLDFVKKIRNSLIFSLEDTLITIVVSELEKYEIMRFFLRLEKLMTKILIVTYMFHLILLAITYTIVIVQMGLMNTWTGLVITYLSFSIPYAVWMLIGFFSTVPFEIEEAAKIDGAGRFVIFSKIVLPIVMPGIVATAVYTFINTWNEFLFALLLINSTNKMPISIALYSLNGSEILDWGQMLAASVIIVLPSIIFFMFIQK